MAHVGISLDDFRDVSPWGAVTSGEAQLALRHDAGPDEQSALRLEYDFKSGGGFVVARRALVRTMPTAWAVSLRVRGAAPANHFEIKFADGSGRNVWWWRREAFVFTEEWQTLRIRSSEVSFAWGPAGGGALDRLGSLEIAIAAGPGGRGCVRIADLRFEDLSLKEPPLASASSSQPGHEPQRALDASASTWCSSRGARSAWFALDFGHEYEYGGLVIDWAHGAARSFDVECSDDSVSWRVLASASQAEGERSYVYVPGGGCSRYLRLSLHELATDAQSFEVRTVEVRPFGFSRSLAEFFSAVAACEPRGHHPRWLHREQSYWTPVGVAGGTTAAILNEEGLLEPDRASFSLEPFLFADGKLLTWADAPTSVSLAQNKLPIPSSTWHCGDITLSTTAFATLEAGRPVTRVVYRVKTSARAARSVKLFVALRPFQVSPPWQAHQGIGGTAEIRSLVWRDGAVIVNDTSRVTPRVAPDGFGAAAFEQGGVLRHLARGELPPRESIVDAFRHGSGALCWNLELTANAMREVKLDIPFMERPELGPVSSGTTVDAAAVDIDDAELYWLRKLDRVRIEIAATDAACVDTLRTAIGHILVNRDGPAIQPGPRRYTRSWIRDGATMAAALLRMGCCEEVRDFLAWYATWQKEDGNVPCVVDRNGADWLPEHDSHGQLVFTLAEYFRFTGDRDFVAMLWPAARRAIGYLEALLATRRTQDFRDGERRACFGILPESASHEGYLAQPVHAYWDDFWALRGIGDGAELARVFGDSNEAQRLTALCDELGKCLYASIEMTIADRGLAYIPGSVEWADFDPTATATAIATTDAAERLPQSALAFTFDEYLRGLRKRRDGEIDWNNYSAYEIRILGALVRLGRRADTHELLDYFLADRRPQAWNQWPEISWRNPRSPGHLGDVPHAWIGAEYVLAVLSLFAYERPADAALVIAEGISDAWLDRGDVVVDGLRTWWGLLGYSLRRDGPSALHLEFTSQLAVPPGGIFIRPPLPRPLVAVEVDGAPHSNFDARGVTLHHWPASVVMRCE